MLSRVALSLVCCAALVANSWAQAAPNPHKIRGAVQRSKAQAPPALGPAYAARADVMAQADDIAQRRDLDPSWVRRVLGEARYVPVVAKLVLPPPPGRAKNWRVYRSRFIEPQRIQAGLRFWQVNRAALERAQAEFGVPAEIVVGIIGVESIYGQQTGSFRVIDTLTTLAFDFPSQHPRAVERAAYFKGELEQFLSLSQRSATDPLLALGSYAGATGMAQFMPSSLVRYALDYDGDGRIDLVNSPTDVIGSVANYFKAFKWQSGMSTHYPLQWDEHNPHRATLLAPDILPTFSPARLRELGVVLDDAAAQHPGLLAVVELQNGDPADARNPSTYVLGTDNFYAVTRYNWSSYYALAVIELGREVAARLPQP